MDSSPGHLNHWSSAQPQLYSASPDNTAINVSVWLTTTLVILVVLVKLSLKYAQLRMLMLDDAFILVAAVLAVAQSVTTLEQAASGLGQSQLFLPLEQLVSFQKADYTASVLYLLAVGVCKMAFAATIDHMSTTALHRRLSRALLVFVAIWALVGFIASLAQCTHADESWMVFAPQCFNQSVFWAVMSTFDIVSDAALVGLAAYILWGIQAATSRKVKIIAVFSTKLISLPLVTIRTVLIRQAIPSSDRTAATLGVAIATQFAMNLGIIATCLPYLKARLCGMEDGIFTKDMRIDTSRVPQVKVVKFVETPYDRRPSLPKPRPAPLKSRHYSLRATAAKSPGANSPVTPSKMTISKHTSVWVEEEETPPEISLDIPRQSEDWFPS